MTVFEVQINSTDLASASSDRFNSIVRQWFLSIFDRLAALAEAADMSGLAKITLKK